MVTVTINSDAGRGLTIGQSLHPGGDFMDMFGSVTTMRYTHYDTFAYPYLREYYDVRGDSPFDKAMAVISSNWYGYMVETIRFFDVGEVGVVISDLHLDPSSVHTISERSGFNNSDDIRGNSYADHVEAYDGDDLIVTGGGNDYLHGNIGKDRLIGGTGLDTLLGGTGMDRLNGGLGADTLTGGTSKDIFVFKPAEMIDVITDFQNGLDKIEMQGSAERFSNLRFRDDGKDVVILSKDITIRLQEVERTAISADDFIFA